MPIAQLRGVNINYEVLGSAGPWVALSPGGRRALDNVKSLAQHVANAGYRVLIHDRRNCGLSDIAIGAEMSEYEVWAEDLHALLSQLNALPAVLGGGSSGCRLSVLFALKYPHAVRALLLWRVTGGRFACERLAENYYGQFIKLAQSGGMKAVAESEHWAERIRMRPQNGDTLMKMDAKHFIAAMEHWRGYFLRGADLPVIGATEADLKSIKVPTCIVPGNDKTHGNAVGDIAKRLIPNSELHKIMGPDMDVDLGPIEEWEAKDGEMAALFDGFLRRALQSAAA